MMNGAGTGMLIPYSHVGRLALRVFNELKPLMDGPFGEGADVPFKAIGSIKLVISEGPLEQETFHESLEFFLNFQDADIFHFVKTMVKYYREEHGPVTSAKALRCSL